MPTGKATLRAEYLMHQYQWRHARDLWAAADADECPERALLCGSLLCVAFAVEAHANRLLELGCPEVYEKEQVFFSRDEFVGTVGKLRFLARKLSVPPHRGRRPLQSIDKLFRWRNDMVHARVERIEQTRRYRDPRLLRSPDLELMAFPMKHGKRIWTDAERVADGLQKAANEANWGRDVLGTKAFSGFLGTRGISLSG